MKYATTITLICLLAAGTLIMSHNWSAIERENNAFAKDCNDRGGVARFEFDARQCIGAKKGGAS